MPQLRLSLIISANKKKEQELDAGQASIDKREQESSTYSGNSASGGSAGGAYYKNCKAVWDALGHGITRNDLGYRSKLDADGDGYACEYPPNY